MGGVNPFRLPEPQFPSFRAYPLPALIGPVWNHGITGQPDENNGLADSFGVRTRWPTVLRTQLRF